MNYDNAVDMARTMESARRWQRAACYWQLAADFAGADERRRLYCQGQAMLCLSEPEIKVSDPRPTLWSRLVNIFRNSKTQGA